MKIFWIEIQNLKYKDLFTEITKFEKQNIVFTPNPEILLKIKSDEEFKNILLKADFLTSDGIWLYIAYQILDNKFWKFINFLLLPYFFFNLFFRRKYLYEKYWDRICGSDLTKDLLNFSERNNVKIKIIDLYNPLDEKKVASQNIFEENQNDTADILFHDNKFFEVIDVKTRNMAKSAMAPNIISAYKVAQICTFIIDNEE